MFFWLSKIGWFFVSPDSLLVILLLIACVLLWRGSFTKAKFILSAVTFTLIILAFVPIGSWLNFPLENRFPTNPQLPEKVDGIIVLSGGESARRSAAWKQIEFTDAAERNTAFMALIKRYPEATPVFTGGTGSLRYQEFKSADAARQFFENQGLDVERIVFERESKNTYENMVFSKRLVEPKNGEIWVLVTSAFHMPRSVGLFCQGEWPVIPYPVDHRGLPEIELIKAWDLSAHLTELVNATREWLGLVVYYITGKTDALLPGNCNISLQE